MQVFMVKDRKIFSEQNSGKKRLILSGQIETLESVQ
jgi:hypothetical protein